jgi:hypothetical protein
MTDGCRNNKFIVPNQVEFSLSPAKDSLNSAVFDLRSFSGRENLKRHTLC